MKTHSNFEVIDAGERADVSVSVSALNRNPEKLSSEYIARAIESTCNLYAIIVRKNGLCEKKNLQFDVTTGNSRNDLRGVENSLPTGIELE